MNLTVKLFLTALISFVGLGASAQQSLKKENELKADSIKLLYLTEAAIRNPILRQVVVSTDITSKSDIHSKLYGNDFFQGKMSQARTNVFVTLPLASWGKNSITGSLSYEHQQFYFSDIDIANPAYEKLFNDTKNYHDILGFNLGYQRMDSLLGRDIIYTVNLNGQTGKKSTIQRLTFVGSALINLKHTKKTNLSAGLVLNIDPSINIPVFPIFTYWHDFGKGFEANINLPQQAYLRKEVKKDFFVRIGTAMNVSSSFLHNDNQTLIPSNINYTALSLQNGIGIDYRLAKKIIISANAGIQTPLSARAFEVGEKSNNYFVKNKIGATPFVKISVSLLPVITSLF